VRPRAVEVDPPRLDLRPRILQVGEPVLVEALVTQLAFEALDVGVLDRLPGPDELQLDPALVRPASSARPTNSGPLSLTIVSGRPRS